MVLVSRRFFSLLLLSAIWDSSQQWPHKQRITAFKNKPTTARVTNATNSSKLKNNYSVAIKEDILKRFRTGLPTNVTDNKLILRSLEDSSLKAVPIINLPFIISVDGLVREALNYSWRKSYDSEFNLMSRIPTLTDSIHKRLQIASRLRDNIVTVLGFILFQPRKRTSLDLYAALYDIYTAFRLRRIRTVEMIDLIMQIAGKTPTQQLISLFSKVLEIAPRYLKGALKVCLHDLENKIINLDEILRHDEGPLAVDLLAGIDNKMASQLHNVLQFEESSELQAPPTITRNMGQFFGNLFGALIEGSLKPSPQLVAGIMLHVQLYKFIPDVEEALRYLSEIFLEERRVIDFAFHNISRAEKRNPYILVRFILRKLSRNNKIDVNIREAADIVLLHFYHPNRFTINPNLQVMSNIVSSSTINFSLLFKTISPGEFPDDVVQAINMILGAINRNEIDMNFVLKGFVRYDYQRPLDLMIAIIDRLRRRTFLPVDIIDATNSVYIHLKLKSAHENMPLSIYTTFENFVPLFDSFSGPAIPDEVEMQSKGILEEISKENNINWKSELAKYPSIENSRPRQLVYRVLNSLSSRNISNPDLITDVRNFLDLLTPEGDPKQCPVVSCPFEASPIVLRTTTTTTTPQPPTPKIIPKRAENIDVHDILNAIDISVYDESKIAPLEQFLQSPPGIGLMRKINLIEYKTRGSLLRQVLEVLSKDQNVRRDPLLNHTLWEIKDHVLLEGSGAVAVKWRKSTVTFVVNMDGILQALDKTEIERDGESGAFEHIYGFLHKNLKAQYLSNFDATTPKTRHEFLKALFNHLLDATDVPPDVKEDIRVLINYIQETGSGAHPPDYVAAATS
ncbi:uncharacterized protein [Periplaneta americana]|uniref:uncharacterized protein n=1 Tax=Periplaneta americana TaxID=6978 RepID=UPI0037E7784D